MDLDKMERSRRSHQVEEFEQMGDRISNRSHLMQQWKKKRMDNYSKLFLNIVNEAAHKIVIDENGWHKDGWRINRDRAIGTGIYGQIYAARKKRKRNIFKSMNPFAKEEVRHAAVKVYNRRDEMKTFAIPNFSRQMRILLALNHRNIIRIYSIYELRNSDRTFIFMERAEENLDHLVRCKGRLQETPLAKKWTRDIVYALDFLHNLGIAHRRIQPSHVMIKSPNHAAKITAPDCLAEIKSTYNTGCVRNEFTAPEVNFGTGFDALAADCWSVGCVCYFMLTKNPPFDHYMKMESMKEQLDKRTWRNDAALSEEAKAFLSGLLHGTIDKRMNTTEMLAHSYFDFASSVGSSGSSKGEK